MASYGQEHVMGPQLASYMFRLLNAGSLWGVLAGALAQYLGQFNVITFHAMRLHCYCSIDSRSPRLLDWPSFLCCLGATSGIMIALMMSTIAYTASSDSLRCRGYFAYGF
ncbi:hypothetical protein BKA65DRAFT_242551 [Rhexocercosporidium sp. MPI-PUGE-AT-0058]|nr:hypothetical protein BKA65DRAFT_242551 [Rhexocercosporidium sp. MPI-PUGE-AT-0058]